MIPGYEEIAQFLVDHDAELNFVDLIGMTPIHYAVENGLTKNKLCVNQTCVV